MGDQDDPRPGLAGGVGDQAVAGDAGGGGQAGGRLVASPRQTPPVGADGAGGGLGAGGPVGAFGVDAVIDGQGQQRALPGVGPVGGEVEQGDGIPPAGQGDDERAPGLCLQPGGQAALSRPDPVRRGLAQPGLRAGGRVVAGARAGVQAKRAPISVARVRWAAVAVAA